VAGAPTPPPPPPQQYVNHQEQQQKEGPIPVIGNEILETSVSDVPFPLIKSEENISSTTNTTINSSIVDHQATETQNLMDVVDEQIILEHGVDSSVNFHPEIPLQESNVPVHSETSPILANLPIAIPHRKPPLPVSSPPPPPPVPPLEVLYTIAAGNIEGDTHTIQNNKPLPPPIPPYRASMLLIGDMNIESLAPKTDEQMQKDRIAESGEIDEINQINSCEIAVQNLEKRLQSLSNIFGNVEEVASSIDSGDDKELGATDSALSNEQNVKLAEVVTPLQSIMQKTHNQEAPSQSSFLPESITLEFRVGNENDFKTCFIELSIPSKESDEEPVIVYKSKQNTNIINSTTSSFTTLMTTAAGQNIYLRSILSNAESNALQPNMQEEKDRKYNTSETTQHMIQAPNGRRLSIMSLTPGAPLPPLPPPSRLTSPPVTSQPPQLVDKSDMEVPLINEDEDVMHSFVPFQNTSTFKPFSATHSFDQPQPTPEVTLLKTPDGRRLSIVSLTKGAPTPPLPPPPKVVVTKSDDIVPSNPLSATQLESQEETSLLPIQSSSDLHSPPAPPKHLANDTNITTPPDETRPSIQQRIHNSSSSTSPLVLNYLKKRQRRATVVERLLQKGLSPPGEAEQSPKGDDCVDNMLVVRDSYSAAASLSPDMGGEVVDSVRLSDDASINNRSSIADNNSSNSGKKGDKKNYFVKLTSFFNGKKGINSSSSSSSSSPTAAVASVDSPTASSPKSPSWLGRRRSSSSAKELMIDNAIVVKNDEDENNNSNHDDVSVEEIEKTHKVEEVETTRISDVKVDEGDGDVEGEDSAVVTANTTGPTRRSSELDYSAVYDDKDNDISRFEELYCELKQDAFAAPNEVSPFRRLLLHSGSKTPTTSPSSSLLANNKRVIHS